MQAVEVTAPHQLHLTEKPVPDVGANQVRLRVYWAGVCGTDYSLIGGKLAFARYPIVPGHEFSGRISALGAGAPFTVGQPVTINPILSCRQCAACQRGEIHHCEQTAVLGVAGVPGGFADEVVVPADAVRVLPDELPLDAAALTEPVAVVVRVLHSAGVKSGDRVAVLGGGNIGLLVVQAALAAGASVAVTDPISSRMQVARQLGADGLDTMNAGQFDAVIDGVGTPETLALAVRLARRGGSIAVYGVPSQEQAVLPMLDMFRKDLRVAFSRLYPADFTEAIDLLCSGRLNWQAVVTHRVGLADLPAAVRQVMADPSSGIKILVRVAHEAG
ncbi:MAG: alcohol dehydrogenase catalytic domain-containing protein [Chloroflexi bacterium]|nr:alcohol dehydrogenase catalytic domain-containing protein [Chloroflexota bacterium]